uniref:Uncharacterized protein n=1 Tax=Caenorhabditis japonica TaxID=281687 RepID=A0A8R1I0V1_CAEJA
MHQNMQPMTTNQMSSDPNNTFYSPSSSMNGGFANQQFLMQNMDQQYPGTEYFTQQVPPLIFDRRAGSADEEQQKRQTLSNGGMGKQLSPLEQRPGQSVEERNGQSSAQYTNQYGYNYGGAGSSRFEGGALPSIESQFNSRSMVAQPAAPRYVPPDHWQMSQQQMIYQQQQQQQQKSLQQQVYLKRTTYPSGYANGGIGTSMPAHLNPMYRQQQQTVFNDGLEMPGTSDQSGMQTQKQPPSYQDGKRLPSLTLPPRPNAPEQSSQPNDQFEQELNHFEEILRNVSNGGIKEKLAPDAEKRRLEAVEDERRQREELAREKAMAFQKMMGGPPTEESSSGHVAPGMYPPVPQQQPQQPMYLPENWQGHITGPRFGAYYNGMPFNGNFHQIAPSPFNYQIPHPAQPEAEIEEEGRRRKQKGAVVAADEKLKKTRAPRGKKAADEAKEAESIAPNWNQPAQMMCHPGPMMHPFPPMSTNGFDPMNPAMGYPVWNNHHYPGPQGMAPPTVAPNAPPLDKQPLNAGQPQKDGSQPSSVDGIPGAPLPGVSSIFSSNKNGQPLKNSADLAQKELFNNFSPNFQSFSADSTNLSDNWEEDVELNHLVGFNSSTFAMDPTLTYLQSSPGSALISDVSPTKSIDSSAPCASSFTGIPENLEECDAENFFEKLSFESTENPNDSACSLDTETTSKNVVITCENPTELSVTKTIVDSSVSSQESASVKVTDSQVETDCGSNTDSTEELKEKNIEELEQKEADEEEEEEEEKEVENQVEEVPQKQGEEDDDEKSLGKNETDDQKEADQPEEQSNLVSESIRQEEVKEKEIEVEEPKSSKIDAEEDKKAEEEEQQKDNFAEQEREDAEKLIEKESEEQKLKELEEQKKKEAEERRQIELEDLKRRVAEERRRRELEEEEQKAAEKLKAAEELKAEELKNKIMEEQKLKEAEEQERKAAEEMKRKESEELKQKELDELRKREVEEQEQKTAEELQEKEAKEKERKAAEQVIREVAEQQNMLELEEQKKKEAEELKKNETRNLKRMAEEVLANGDDKLTKVQPFDPVDNVDVYEPARQLPELTFVPQTFNFYPYPQSFVPTGRPTLFESSVPMDPRLEVLKEIGACPISPEPVEETMEQEITVIPLSPQVQVSTEEPIVSEGSLYVEAEPVAPDEILPALEDVLPMDAVATENQITVDESRPVSIQNTSVVQTPVVQNDDVTNKGEEKQEVEEKADSIVAENKEPEPPAPSGISFRVNTIQRPKPSTSISDLLNINKSPEPITPIKESPERRHRDKSPSHKHKGNRSSARRDEGTSHRRSKYRQSSYDRLRSPRSSKSPSVFSKKRYRNASPKRHEENSIPIDEHMIALQLELYQSPKRNHHLFSRRTRSRSKSRKYRFESKRHASDHRRRPSPNASTKRNVKTPVPVPVPVSAPVSAPVPVPTAVPERKKATSAPIEINMCNINLCDIPLPQNSPPDFAFGKGAAKTQKPKDFHEDHGDRIDLFRSTKSDASEEIKVELSFLNSAPAVSADSADTIGIFSGCQTEVENIELTILCPPPIVDDEKSEKSQIDADVAELVEYLICKVEENTEMATVSNLIPDGHDSDASVSVSFDDDDDDDAAAVVHEGSNVIHDDVEEKSLECETLSTPETNNNENDEQEAEEPSVIQVVQSNEEEEGAEAEEKTALENLNVLENNDLNLEAHDELVTSVESTPIAPAQVEEQIDMEIAHDTVPADDPPSENEQDFVAEFELSSSSECVTENREESVPCTILATAPIFKWIATKEQTEEISKATTPLGIETPEKITENLTDPTNELLEEEDPEIDTEPDEMPAPVEIPIVKETPAEEDIPTPEDSYISQTISFITEAVRWRIGVKGVPKEFSAQEMEELVEIVRVEWQNSADENRGKKLEKNMAEKESDFTTQAERIRLAARQCCELLRVVNEFLEIDSVKFSTDKKEIMKKFSPYFAEIWMRVFLHIFGSTKYTNAEELKETTKQTRNSKKPKPLKITPGIPASVKCLNDVIQEFKKAKIDLSYENNFFLEKGPLQKLNDKVPAQKADPLVVFADEDVEMRAIIGKTPLRNHELHFFWRALDKVALPSDFRGCLKFKNFSADQKLYMLCSTWTFYANESGFFSSDLAVAIVECAYYLAQSGAFGMFENIENKLKIFSDFMKLSQEERQRHRLAGTCLTVVKFARRGLAAVDRSFSAALLKFCFIHATDPNCEIVGQQIALPQCWRILTSGQERWKNNAKKELELSERVLVTMSSPSSSYIYHDEYPDSRVNFCISPELAPCPIQNETDEMPKWAEIYDVRKILARACSNAEDAGISLDEYMEVFVTENDRLKIVSEIERHGKEALKNQKNKNKKQQSIGQTLVASEDNIFSDDDDSNDVPSKVPKSTQNNGTTVYDDDDDDEDEHQQTGPVYIPAPSKSRSRPVPKPLLQRPEVEDVEQNRTPENQPPTGLRNRQKNNAGRSQATSEPIVVVQPMRALSRRRAINQDEPTFFEGLPPPKRRRRGAQKINVIDQNGSSLAELAPSESSSSPSTAIKTSHSEVSSTQSEPISVIRTVNSSPSSSLVHSRCAEQSTTPSTSSLPVRMNPSDSKSISESHPEPAVDDSSADTAKNPQRRSLYVVNNGVVREEVLIVGKRGVLIKSEAQRHSTSPNSCVSGSSRSSSPEEPLSSSATQTIFNREWLDPVVSTAYRQNPSRTFNKEDYHSPTLTLPCGHVYSINKSGKTANEECCVCHQQPHAKKEKASRRRKAKTPPLPKVPQFKKDGTLKRKPGRKRGTEVVNINGKFKVIDKRVPGETSN